MDVKFELIYSLKYHYLLVPQIPKLGIRIIIMAGLLFAAVGQIAFE